MQNISENGYDAPPWSDKKKQPLIKINNITKKFGEITALNNVGLKIYAGELFCLLGGSGCGKSTLLRILAGLETPTTGKIIIDGTDVTPLPPYERSVNMMFQSYALFPHMTVEKNIAYGLKREGMAKSDIRKRVNDVLELVQLSSFGKRYPHQLSGGQQQRVALARCIVKRPKVLLLDEPLAALDKGLREQTQFELMNIQHKLGITFIVVTHDQQEAMTLSTRIAVMKEGQIVQIGTATEIYEYPKTRFTANFIGSINIFEGVVIKNSNDLQIVKCEEAGCDLLVNRDPSIQIGNYIGVALRPEKINLSKADPGRTDCNTLKGKVLDFGYLGNLSIFNIKINSGKIVKVSVPNQMRFSKPQVKWGDEVYLSWEANNTLILKE